MALTPEQFIARLRAIPQKIRSMDSQPALSSAAEQVRASVKKNFGRQTDSGGNVWPPRKDDLPHPLLILTSAMFEASSGGAGSFTNFSQAAVEIGIIGAAIPYAAVHQYGAGRVPRREYFYLNKEEEPLVSSAFGVEISKEFRRRIAG